MELRFQHILLGLTLWCASSFALASGKLDVNNEYFEVSISAGVLAIQDFNSELSLGLAATFNASENFFLQYNYMEATASESAFELSSTPNFTGKDRDFSHYNLLLGYNLFHGEVFMGKSTAQLSTLYTVLGAGDTTFGGESSFTIVWGVGYKFGLSRKINMSVDFRDYAFDTILADVEQSTHNMHLSLSLGYLW